MDGNKSDRKNEEIEHIDLDEEERNSPEDNWEDDWVDEPEPMQPWKMTLVFAGLVVLAAVIVAGLWFFTHRDGGSAPDNTATDPPVMTTDSPASSAGEQNGDIASPDGQTSEGQSPNEQLPESVGEEGADIDATASPEAEQTPLPTQGAAIDSTEPEDQPTAQEPQDGDATMRFDPVQESVTPKDVVNLRSVPSTVDADTVVTQSSNGEVLSRIGINANTGWSQIDYNGQILYAVTQYLTTDLSYKTPVTPSDPNRVSTISGRVIIFNNCDDYITPKEYVNLRTEPSTTEDDATVSCQVSNGEAVHRTGVSPDSGWSRVEYNGQVLYVVTSLMKAVQ